MISVCRSKDLYLSFVTVQVDEDKFLSLVPNGQYSSSHCYSVLVKKDVLFDCSWVPLGVEFVKFLSPVELVRIWVSSLIPNTLNEILSVLSVLCRVEVIVLYLAGISD